MTIIPFSTLKADQLHPRQHMPIDYRQVNVKEVMLACFGKIRTGGISIGKSGIGRNLPDPG